MDHRRSHRYVWEKLDQAVRGLATGSAPPRERLATAYVYHLMHLERRDLPDEIRETFADLEEALSREKAMGDAGSAMASASALDELEIDDLIDSIIDMYDRVAKYGPNG